MNELTDQTCTSLRVRNGLLMKDPFEEHMKENDFKSFAVTSEV